MRVETYRNLHTDTLSVRQVGGRVFSHPLMAFVQNPTFVVQPKGREKVLSTGQKNVHAFVRGEFVLPDDVAWPPCFTDGTWSLARYNPREVATFVDAESGQPVLKANEAVVTTAGVYYR